MPPPSCAALCARLANTICCVNLLPGLFIRHNQEGVNSHRFQPGPLSEMEWGISAFYHTYFALIRAELG